MENKSDIEMFGSSDLCFDVELFMGDNFSVDEFMREYHCTGDGNLDTLRDHLGIYLKQLRSAMIDLINRDYADFVNLSTNLTGLDGLIKALTVPLGQLREEVLSVSQVLESACSGVLSDLEKQTTIEKYKKKLSTLSDISKRLDNLEELLSQGVFNTNQRSHSPSPATSEDTDSDNSPPVDSFKNMCLLEVCSKEELLDRFAAEISYLNYLSSTCEGTKLIEMFKPRISQVQSAVEDCIRQNIKSCVDTICQETGDEPEQNDSRTVLRRTLIACSVMDCTALAEETVREILSPRIREVMNEESLRESPRGVAEVLSATLTVVTNTCQQLILLTLPQRTANAVEEVPGFSFLESSAFPEVTAAVAAIPHLCSPANPAAFHQRYLECVRFVSSFEELLMTKARIDAFRSTPAYCSFLDLWNLPVYFQIRNQEIGQVVESSLCEETGLKLYPRHSLPAIAACTTGSDASEQAGDDSMVLSSTRGVLRGITQCWQHEVYLPPLLHRFWKLTLLILSRHRTWLDKTIDSNKPGSRGVASIPLQSPTGAPSPPSSEVQLSVQLLADLHLLALSFDQLYTYSIAEHVAHLESRHKSVITDTLLAEVSKLRERPARLVTHLTQSVSQAMVAALRPLTDTPRRYRRTNRAAPTAAQPYVSEVLAPLQQLHAITALPHCYRLSCYTTITATAAKQFHALASEVLGSVSKTEESLRRLKRARGNTTPQTPATGLSDEDKIREQLHLDVGHFGRELEGMGVSVDAVPEYTQLAETVSQARTAQLTS